MPLDQGHAVLPPPPSFMMCSVPTVGEGATVYPVDRRTALQVGNRDARYPQTALTTTVGVPQRFPVGCYVDPVTLICRHPPPTVLPTQKKSLLPSPHVWVLPAGEPREFATILHQPQLFQQLQSNHGKQLLQSRHPHSNSNPIDEGNAQEKKSNLLQDGPVHSSDGQHSDRGNISTITRPRQRSKATTMTVLHSSSTMLSVEANQKIISPLGVSGSVLESEANQIATSATSQMTVDGSAADFPSPLFVHGAVNDFSTSKDLTGRNMASVSASGTNEIDSLVEFTEDKQQTRNGKRKSKRRGKQKGKRKGENNLRVDRSDHTSKQCWFGDKCTRPDCWFQHTTSNHSNNNRGSTEGRKVKVSIPAPVSASSLHCPPGLVAAVSRSPTTLQNDVLKISNGMDEEFYPVPISISNFQSDNSRIDLTMFKASTGEETGLLNVPADDGELMDGIMMNSCWDLLAELQEMPASDTNFQINGLDNSRIDLNMFRQNDPAASAREEWCGLQMLPVEEQRRTDCFV